LTSGERVPINVDKARGTGLQAGFGYRFSDWFSWSMVLAAHRSQQTEYNYLTQSGTTHSMKVESAFVYLSPFTWTAYPINWLYVSAGFGWMVEGQKATTNITNINNFETGSFGGIVTLAAGVELPINNTLMFRAGLQTMNGKLAIQEKKLNEGTVTEYTAKLEERNISSAMLTLGMKAYFK
jgi:hypothetical protein